MARMASRRGSTASQPACPGGSPSSAPPPARYSTFFAHDSNAAEPSYVKRRNPRRRCHVIEVGNSLARPADGQRQPATALTEALDRRRHGGPLVPRCARQVSRQIDRNGPTPGAASVASPWLNSRQAVAHRRRGALNAHVRVGRRLRGPAARTSAAVRGTKATGCTARGCPRGRSPAAPCHGASGLDQHCTALRRGRPSRHAGCRWLPRPV